MAGLSDLACGRLCFVCMTEMASAPVRHCIKCMPISHHDRTIITREGLKEHIIARLKCRCPTACDCLVVSAGQGAVMARRCNASTHVGCVAHLIQPPSARAAPAILVQQPCQRPLEWVKGQVPQQRPDPRYHHKVPANTSQRLTSRSESKLFDMQFLAPVI